MDIHREPDAPTGSTTLLAVDGAEVVAAVRRLDEPSPVLAVDVVAPDRVGRDEARDLVEAVAVVVGDDRPRPRGLLVSDPLVRHEARQFGWDGPLRGVLTAPASGVVGAPVSLVESVAGLLTDCDVRARRSLFRSPDLHVDSRGRAGTLRIRVPRDTEVMAEAVAAAVDTALAVKARFGRAASGIGGLSFDSGGIALATGEVSGQAEGASGVVVLSPNFAGAEQCERERRARAQSGRRARPELAGVPPYLQLDVVVAHECWHYLDAEIRVSGTVYVEFNAALGEALGVQSLELALRGGERNAPAEWRAARERLVEQVTNYASTSPREATAEMFSLWWCGLNRDQPVIARFGELVERAFPAVS